MCFNSFSALVFTAALLLPALPSRPVPTFETGAAYVNPVIDRNFPDPSVLEDNGVYYAYATNSHPSGNSPRQNMPCARSTDLVHWTLLPDATPRLPLWAKPGRTWAPEVRRMPHGGYVAYFTAWDAATNQQEVGVGTSASPAGPFFSPFSQPLVDQPDDGGAIDCSCFIDADGSRDLVWKNDGNSRGKDTWLWVQKLAPDSLHLLGTPKKLIKEDQPWEGNLVEAPTLWKHGAKYYLFYSANAYVDCRYAIGYAVSGSVTGPYVKPRTTPWLASSPGVCGPGGEDIVTAHDGTTWMAYHTWAKGPGSYRAMSIDKLNWVGTVPVLDGPSRMVRVGPAVQPEGRK